MQQHIQSIVQHFFQKSSLHDVAEDDLQQFTNDYPYAIIGQFLLAEKMRHDNQEAFHDQALRTSLYFNNPAWLYWQLQEHQEANLEGLKAAITMIDEPVAEEAKQVVAYTEPGTGDIIAIGNKAVETTPSIPLSDPAEQHKAAIDSQPAAETKAVAEQQGSTESQSAITEQQPTTENNTEKLEEAAPNSAVSLAEAVSATTPQPVINEIGFDPYHTIDYFASQGIKLKLEELAKDKLGMQLKSFTEWLRSMKRIGPASINGAALDDSTQQAIQNIADTSIEGKDIVTEAMAEVWVKQGNYRKAISIYEKLSLQNPVKSPYFADRIQQLKAL
jgi:tetratricopeptide (TPR) repeat protein